MSEVTPPEEGNKKGISRRGLMIGGAAGAAGIAAVYFMGRGGGGGSSATDCITTDLSDTEAKLNVSNWPEYIDEDDGDYLSTLTEFQQTSGIEVAYTPDVNDNVEFFAKVRNQLGACQPTGRDLFVLTDWMAARMIDADWIQQLDKANVPNLDKNLISSLQGPGWDPNRDYSAPWQSGFTGIAYNKSLVGEVGSVSELLTRSDLKGKVTMLTEMRDTMGLLLLAEGADPSNFTDDQWGNALDKLAKARTDGQIRAFTGNEYINDLAAGNIAACVAWSGDVAAAEDENLVFLPPEEGLMIWSDNMLVPVQGTHKANAEKWIDYYYDPAVAAKLAAYVWYVCPVEGAREEMEKIDPSLVDNPLIFPTADYLAQTHGFMALDEAKASQYEKDFADVTG
ncbi:spermidine/putrescine ABC transporter substrate-binding protein [Demequina sp. SYSU T00039]|uniref:Spermidine/putrescine ABC transporter substrate-binding protein n=1 Tax=Demequina lignilytica TaxID=3051663 RepID=A0AAW7M450_9MICO|nr:MULTISPECIES: spermidine/putrescine ABC transporter substrate-binding protein [unclassified Demequina]MDN4478063.1 spermidine/putrescine ABC transporter substrate-binding protein [Demequina sp. SYSU T00039-1]MDN4488487.1 spermidine/putrescine ABC transporter substrate-binding protein [Demequina sp. SYSU T00039]